MIRAMPITTAPRKMARATFLSRQSWFQTCTCGVSRSRMTKPTTKIANPMPEKITALRMLCQLRATAGSMGSLLYLWDPDEPPEPRAPPDDDELVAAGAVLPNRDQPWYFATEKPSRTSRQ